MEVSVSSGNETQNSYRSEIRSETGTTEVDSKDYFEGFDFGLNTGVGFNYRLAEATWLNFGVAYTHGRPSY